MLSELNANQNTYLYSSLPRKLEMNWKGPFAASEDHSEESQNQQHARCGNIMSDKRVVRGSTIGPPITLKAGSKLSESRQTEVQRRGRARKRAEEYQSRVKLKVGTPPPVQGRLHMDVQTDTYLEELFLNPSSCSTACQTDPVFDLVEPSCCVYPKPGVDADTQILPEELFDFEEEIRPIVNALVSKTLEQSLIEIMNEKLLKNAKQLAQSNDDESMTNSHHSMEQIKIVGENLLNDKRSVNSNGTNL